MAFVGGDVLEIACTHPSVGTIRFDVKANESNTGDKGGIRTNDDANSVTGSGKNMRQLNRVRWSWEGPVALDFLSNVELDAINKMAASPEEGVWTFSLIAGVIYKGKGSPVGEHNFDTNNAQSTLKLAGGGELVPIK